MRQLQTAEHERQARLQESSQASARLAQARAEAARLAEQRVQAAADLRQTEAQVAATAQRLQIAADLAAAAEAELAKRQAGIARLLPIIMRLQRYPAETILAVPLPPDQALAGLLITRGLTAQLAQEAGALRDQQAETQERRAEMAAQAARLAAERAIQAGKASALDRQIASIRNDAGEAERAAKAADERAAALAAQAETLRGAIAAIDAAHARARGTHATMLTPVAGPVLRTWGSPAEDGPATGITFGSAPGAFVSSPCAGRVAFAAPFRSYGRLLIIECAGGDDVVLAGLERLDAPLGRAVRAGEPIGRMPDYDPGKTRGRPGLYMELRSAGLGQPQDPVPFLKAHG